MSADRPPAARAHGASALVDRLGRFVFGYRDYLVPAALIAVIGLTRPRVALGSARLDAAVDVLGLLVALAGQCLRVAVIGYAYIQRGGAQKQLSAPKLVDAGFYAHCRNPMYTGDFLLFVGLAMIYNSPAVYLIVLPVVALSLLAIVRAEERFLGQRFGAAYADYCRRVKRFVPRMRGLRATLRGMQFDWRRVLRKEYGTTFAWLSAAFFLLAWQHLVWLGWDGAQPVLRCLLVLYVPVPLAYGYVRWLKKSGRLRSPD